MASGLKKLQSVGVWVCGLEGLRVERFQDSRSARRSSSGVIIFILRRAAPALPTASLPLSLESRTLAANTEIESAQAIHRGV